MVAFVEKAKYLGVMSKVGRRFGVDLHYMKSIFIAALTVSFIVLLDFGMS